MKQRKAARRTILEDGQGKAPLQIKKKIDESNKCNESIKSGKRRQPQIEHMFNTDNGRGPRNVTKITKVTNEGSDRHKKNIYLRLRRKGGPR